MTVALAFAKVVLRPLLLLSGRADPLTLFNTFYEYHEFSAVEIGVFAVQGVISAFLAGAVLQSVNLAAATIRPQLKRSELAAYLVPALVAMFCTAVNLLLSEGSCAGRYTEGGAGTLDKLFNDPRKGASATDSAAVADDATLNELLRLAAYAAFKLLVLSPISLAMPTPTGVFLPTYVGGAACGSLLGTLLRRAAPTLFKGMLPGYLAVTGAAALTTASTRTMSTALVTIELTGQLHLQIPILVATTTSYLVVRLLGLPSLFDAFVAIKQLPGATKKGVPLAEEGPLTRCADTLAGDLVEPYLQNNVYVPRFIERRQLVSLLQLSSASWAFSGVSHVPVVNTEKDRVLLGCITFQALDGLADARDTPRQQLAGYEPPVARSTDTPAEESPPSHAEPAGHSLDLQLDDDDNASPMRSRLGDGAREATPPPARAGGGRRPSLVGRLTDAFFPPKKDAALARNNSSTRLLIEPLLDDDMDEGAKAGVELGEGLGRGLSHPLASTDPAPGEDDVIDLLRDESGAVRPSVDLAPLAVSKHTRLARLTFMVRTLGASTVNVIDEGRLAGVLTRVSLFQVERDLFARIEGRRGSGEMEPATPDGSPLRGAQAPAPAWL